MSIRREYTGDFTPEETYLKNLSDHLEEELKAIKGIVNSIQGDGIWDSIGANDSIEVINSKIDSLEETRSFKMEEANQMLSDIDTLLAVYEK